MTKRNPLLDPRPGDVVENSNGKCRKVTSVGISTSDSFNCRNFGRSWVCIDGKMIWLDAWRRWCREHRAVVVKKGE
jgi:hypothetical protein